MTGGEVFAVEIGRLLVLGSPLGQNTILFRVSSELAEREVEWSHPVRFKFEKREDGTYDLLMRRDPVAA